MGGVQKVDKDKIKKSPESNMGNCTQKNLLSEKGNSTNSSKPHKKGNLSCTQFNCLAPK